MARRQGLTVDLAAANRDREFLEAMAADVAGTKQSQKRAKLILAMLGTADLKTAASRVGIGEGTARKWTRAFNERGWQALLTVQAPRSGDFLARYDIGYWAEQLTTAYLDRSRDYRAIPYGTSKSQPFSDMPSFRQFVESEFLLQAWSAHGKWKRPDLLIVPRDLLRQEKGYDLWTPDLKHLDNEHCRPYVEKASAAIEVETSMWQVKKATRTLSFTVKHEDLDALRNWVRNNRGTPLFIVQVFYDSAYALPFNTFEYLLRLPAKHKRHVPGKRDRTTKKVTYFPPLDEGVLLGDIPEPGVEGRVFKADDGRVTVYGRLKGSQIKPASEEILEALAAGRLEGAKGR
jgi:hypothetical protein